MAVNTTTEWTDPATCPFCGDELASPGAGFVDHLEDNADCEAGFERWRANIAGDLVGEWSGETDALESCPDCGGRTRNIAVVRE